MHIDMPPLRRIRATAPTRICDIGGWTDTRVARWGHVFNIAVDPRAVAEIDVFARGSRSARIVLNAQDYDQRYPVSLNESTWGSHPLLEAAIHAVRPPDDVDIEVTVSSQAPAGASTGTSAAVAVALIGALDASSSGGRTPYQIAYEAHGVETRLLGRESGIQDQLCAALGGINFIDIKKYPRTVVTPIALARGVWDELQHALGLVFLGRPHSSHAVHTTVMETLEHSDPDAGPLATLRRAAITAREALIRGDFDALGRAMRDNTDAQDRLHPALVSEDARTIIEIAARHGALGWKVNGAGGDGGSITLLTRGESATDALLRDIEAAEPKFKRIPIALSSDGLRVSGKVAP